MSQRRVGVGSSLLQGPLSTIITSEVLSMRVAIRDFWAMHIILSDGMRLGGIDIGDVTALTGIVVRLASLVKAALEHAW